MNNNNNSNNKNKNNTNKEDNDNNKKTRNNNKNHPMEIHWKILGNIGEFCELAIFISLNADGYHFKQASY